MKILYVITKSNWGGAQKYVFDLASRFSKNHDVVVVHGGDGLLIDRLKEQGIETIKINSLERDIHVFKEIAVFIKLVSIFKDEVPDIVHVNSSKVGGLGVLVAYIVGSPKIFFTAHGFTFNEKRKHRQLFLIKLASWATVILSDKTITVSEFDKNSAKWMPLVQNKLTVIHNGIDPIDFLDKDPARNFLSQKAGVDFKNQLLIGTIAELHKNKGLEYSIHAVAKLAKEGKKISYLIIGDGEERNKLQELIEELDVADSVFLLGAIEDASKYLRAFDIFALPSIKEGLPYTLLEAAAASLPCISTKVGGIPEIIEHDVSGLLCEPSSAEALHKALKSLLLNKGLGEKFGKKLHEESEIKFQKSAMINKISNLYGLS